MKKIMFATMAVASMAVFAKPVFLETEQFENLGGWSVDSQFIDQMGSSYLLAHGLGAPVADAFTKAEVGDAGRYYVFAKTCNWVAHWSSVKEAPGRFEVVVNGKALDGRDYTVLGTGSPMWGWYCAGAVDLPVGSVEVRLRDLTGFDGRCDAVAIVPEVDVKAGNGIVSPGILCEKLRPKTFLSDVKKFDFVVVGGGVAGICTAISAARLGVKVALVQDRPLLGGNNSSEVRVHIGGAINLPPYERLGDVVAEIGPKHGGNAQAKHVYEDSRKMDAVKAEKNISLFLNTRVQKVEKEGASIKSVTGRNVITGAEIRFEAPLFADCTGDACVGALAGAEYRYGRESKAETGESLAVEDSDRMTMGASVQWYSKVHDNPVSFPKCSWMIKFDEETCIDFFRGDWDWETGLFRDQIQDFERVRDYGMLVAYSNWSYLKNDYSEKEKYANRNLEWMAFVSGKRESRRLIGDHILSEHDVFENVAYEDGTCMTTWSIDLHYPKPGKFKGEQFRTISKHNPHFPYAVPYRCYYSRNIDNLFMAGRNISVTHVALGTVRVMRTLGMMGEVVGMAASICKENSCKPRDVYLSHLDDLKGLMKKGVGLGKPQPRQRYTLGDFAWPKKTDIPPPPKDPKDAKRVY